MSEDLSTLLDNYNASTLRQMAEANDMAITDDDGERLRKHQLLSKLRDEFFDGERVLASFARLSKTERAVLNRLLQRGGRAPKHRFKREVIRAGLATAAPEPKRYAGGRYRSGVPYDDGYIGDPAHAGSRIFEDIIARLTYRGLVFSRGADLNMGGVPFKLRFHPAAELFIPQVIQDILPAPDPIDESDPALQPVEILTPDPNLFLRDLYLYWDFVRRNEVPRLTTGMVGKRSLKAINETLLTPDPLLDKARREDETGRLHLLRQLLVVLGLLQFTGDRLETTLESSLQIPSFWQKPQVEQVRAVLDCWQTLTEFQDFEADELKQYGADLAGARRAILQALKSTNHWLDPAELLEELQFKNTNFLFPERSLVENAGNRSYYYSRHSSFYYYDTPKSLLEIFDRQERAVIEACLSGMLFQLGLVELGRLEHDPTSDPWSVFRLTPLGRQLFKQQDTPPSIVHTGKLLVQPNFQIVAMGPVSLDILARLDLFAVREQADRGAFQYRLTRESVYQAQQAGLSAAEIGRILTDAAGQESLPQNVQRSLAEWGSRHERIVFRQGVSLLQAANAGLLERLLAEPATAGLLARAVAADVALVSPQKQAALVDALRARSLLPAISDTDPQAADRSVLVRADGTIEPIHAVPSLHLRGRLAQFAAAGDDGRWRLTADSVRQAGGSKEKVRRILEMLAALHRGKLPKAVVAMVKKWGGYYGQAAAQTVTLLEFSDREIMQELLKSPPLKELLTPFPTADRALAIVAAGQLEQVKTELAKLGVTVETGLLSA